MGNYESKKRTRPCSSCKRQKLKCQYNESLPCERCVKHGIPCHFPNAQRKGLDQMPSAVPQNAPIPPQGAVPKSSTMPYAFSQSQMPGVELPNMLPSGLIPDSRNLWAHSAEQRAIILQNALESMLAVFQQNQIQHEQQVNFLKSQINQRRQIAVQDQRHVSPLAVSLPSVSEIIDNRTLQEQSKDFRTHGILTKNEAAELLHIFSTKMSGHMFGYDFRQLSVEELWDNSPLLLVSICAVACPHHSILSFKKSRLQESLKWFTSKLLNENYSTDDDSSVESIILGLVIAFLWHESNQLYISVAVQLARIWKLDQFPEKNKKNDLWRLWYLLYIADGTQNLISQKSPSINKQTEPMIEAVRGVLLSHVEDPSLQEVLKRDYMTGATPTTDQLHLLNEVEHSKIKVNTYTLQNMHLCGLVEYHMAIESLFRRGNITDAMVSASQILQPKYFGAPWETNMDLDKWMISWTITLQNIDVQNDAWCLKSTLLYYNFARMHINTRWLSDREATLESSGWLQIWSDASKSADSSHLRDASHDISYSAATSLLKLATKDKDVSSLFQFLPNHVYLMLFFACMIVLEAPSSDALADPSVIKKLKQGYKLVRAFKEMLSSHTFSDVDFTRKIEGSVQSLMTAFISRCAREVKSSAASPKVQEIIQDSDNSADSEPARKTISAWPSVNHGHP